MVRERLKLQTTPLDEARHIFFEALDQAGFFAVREEEIATRESLGRVTSRAVFAQRSVPHFRAAAMDGIAVRSVSTREASPSSPKRLKKDRDFSWVDTGDPIAEEFDAVIMIEQVCALDEETVEIQTPTAAGKHIRAIGEDFARGESVLSASSKIGSEAICALLSTGNLRVWVKKRLRCVFLPTGSELVAPENVLKSGELPETNSILFENYVSQWGGSAHIHAIVQDKSTELRAAFSRALDEFDLVCMGSGTSKGRDDRTASLVREFGNVLIHGIAYHPGHPVLLGVARNKPVIGIPGYPVAAWVCLMQIVKPLLRRYEGLHREIPRIVQGVLAEELRSIKGFREFVRVRLDSTAQETRVYPLPGGASRTSSIARADGWLEVPEEVDIIHAGESVSVNLIC